MKYLIHTLPVRYPYVIHHLIPSMMQQGIKISDIDIYSDAAGDGCLKSTLKSFKQLPETEETWHLQDDIVIASNFAEVTAEYDLPFPIEDVICGFASVYDVGLPGECKPKDMWYSFPCIKIKNHLAHEFVDYIENNDDENELCKIANNMFDDWLFKQFMIKKHPDYIVRNLEPNLVNHIDYLIGGSTLVERKEKIEAKYWNEPKLIEELKAKLS